MRALFLGCHCDDLELGCGSTIHKRSTEWDITCVIFSTEGLCNEQWISVKNCSEKAIGHLGAKDIRFEKFRTNSFYLERQKIWEKLRDLDKEISPDVVFTIEADNQQDHETLYKEATRNFRKSSMVSYKASVRNSPQHCYNYYEKLSIENVNAKKECLKFYPKEYQKYIYFKQENVESILRHGGIYIEEEFAEPFNIVKWIK